MKTCASCKADKALADFGKDRKRPSGLYPYCRECARAKNAAATAAYRVRNPDKGATYMAEKRSDPAVREAQRVRAREIYASDPEKERARKRSYMRANPHIWRNYRAAKPEVHASIKARYRAALLNAMPSWSDLAAIRLIYAEARRVSRETGESHHVDHIIPLQGRNVCGLHVPLNLQILPASSNQSKGNRLVAC